MERKNILFISSWFPNKIEPTNGNFVQRHAEAVSLVHNVEILHTIGDFDQDEKYLFDDRLINGIRTLIVYYKNSKNPVKNFFRRMKAYNKGFSKLQKPDLVHANILHNNMLFAVYLKKKYKIPFVVTEHWTALRKINAEVTSKIIKQTAVIIGNQAEFILPVSNDLLLGLRDLGITTKMMVVPNVVNTQLFVPQRKADTEFTFIHVSNLIPRKNPEKILDVALNLLDKGFVFRFQLGGDGNDEILNKLRNKVENSKFSDKITVFGIQTLNEIADRMGSSNCFILFSEDENQPCVIAESFASEIKVISTNVGGIGEFFPDNAGILLKKVDEAELYSAMVRMLKHDRNDDLSFLSQYAKDTFSQEMIAMKFSAIYAQVLKGLRS
ncbi:glycosyltransferase [Chryseobacterium sp. CFS15]|uniref:glycosyltransferase n=1 Tax=Chryseobacterium sp. CFS15 TaxID=2986946 RepID=UPI0028078091|nr:glycosyltransferase [Chryseobacterium sp. CFS15]MDQ8142935.1 glycosyltransferase [Chryseobacterium sp. CFS15]